VAACTGLRRHARLQSSRDQRASAPDVGNGKFKGITRADLLEVANRFGIGTAKKILKEIAQAVEHWPEFARTAGVDGKEIEKIRSHHQIL